MQAQPRFLVHEFGLACHIAVLQFLQILFSFTIQLENPKLSSQNLLVWHVMELAFSFVTLPTNGDIMYHTLQKITDTCTANALTSLLGNIPAHQQRFWIRLAMPYNQAPPCTRPMTLNASKSGSMATRFSNVNMWEAAWLIVEVPGCALCMEK